MFLKLEFIVKYLVDMIIWTRPKFVPLFTRESSAQERGVVGASEVICGAISREQVPCPFSSCPIGRYSFKQVLVDLYVVLLLGSA